MKSIVGSSRRIFSWLGFSVKRTRRLFVWMEEIHFSKGCRSTALGEVSSLEFRVPRKTGLCGDDVMSITEDDGRIVNGRTGEKEGYFLFAGN
ncbi:hypothetical protein MPTK1_7g06160 [Marchantia polymorpha subsp. ruderalis]|uniref:Uncharacterized protein n=2 Tax=Marchantia polymorpha TaxID=3197 RepID=A0AAF6BWN9_MARPO|nr:hypothetical protein MARPO_0057s0055 [Marchantia polymorpha]BBN16423.1 hypothetical protein Mp_7g06160 [Marchantia polymorpha subsp. ruderalis]|eukprot:PTQ37419.1 hypothetical protein MARPO_0057s0055 [Marchantia polymorpha]